METTLAARSVEPQPRPEDKPDDYGHRTRRCGECGEWLCRWNPGPVCYRHGPRHVMVDSADDLAELMAEAA